MNKCKDISKLWLLLLLLVALVTGCASNGGDPGTLVNLKITPATASIPVTGTLQYTALAIYGNGAARDVTASANWAAGNTSVTFGSSRGLATGAIASALPVVITATYKGMTATAALTVNAATSKGLKLTPALASIPVTGSQQYTATETFSDGSSFDRTAVATWTAPDLIGAGVATILPSGLATGNAVGQSTITARYNSKTATATLTVNAATSVSFTVTPATTSIPVTGTRQYTALETFSDGSTIDRTAVATWTAPDLVGAGVATILPSGLATGNAAGQATITARYNGKTATANLTVNATTAVSFTVTPATTSIPVTGTRQYTALETFSDGSTIDRTAVATWTSPDLVGVGVATILPSGLATGNAAGQSAITAKYNGKTAIVNLTVKAATSVSFTVTPATTSIPVTATRQYTALETFSDGSTIDRTAVAIWTAPDLVGLGVASILPSGLATGNAVGQATITARYNGKTATATLTVNAATSASFTVTPVTTSIPVTGTRQYTALETFSDGSTIDRTAVAIWTAPDLVGVGIASILPSGLATGNAVGQATITARYNGTTATATLTVKAATSVSFKVTPATTSIPVTGTRQYMALETFSDGSTIDRTAVATWTAPDLVGVGVATILPSGLASGAAAGQSTITAKYTGVDLITKTGTAILTVTPSVVPVINPGPAGSVDLLSVAPFGIIAYDAITISAGHIYGDVALTQPGPGGTIASVTGAGTNNSGVAPLLASSNVTTSNGVTPGVITAANNGTPINIAALPQLLVDLKIVYDDLMTRAAPLTPITTIASAVGLSGGTFPAAAPDLSGYVLSPGIYTTTGTYGLSNALGPLVLDAGGNPDAVFIIRSTAVGPSGLTSTTGSVLLQNGAQSKNVFWVVDNLTVGAGTFFQGTVVAGHAITLNTFANAEGRMLAGALSAASGAIVLSGTNVITVPQ